MKIRITLKDPDGIHECITEAIEETRPQGLSDSEWEDIAKERHAAISHSRFIEYGDYVTVELDTEADTAIVVPR
jgi:hypothetical protein